jgi:hypothetical protein
MPAEHIRVAEMEEPWKSDWEAMTMGLLDIRTGKSLCIEAVVEVDKDKLKSQLGAAETAMFNRLQAISRSPDHAAEHQAIADALALIRVLKRDALDFPEWEKK